MDARTDTPATESFYAQALDAAEREALAAAGQVQGFDEEIAALRLRIRQALTEHPGDASLLLRSMDTLRRLVVARYGLSKQDEAEMNPFIEETRRRLAARGGDKPDA